MATSTFNMIKIVAATLSEKWQSSTETFLGLHSSS
jgi:hypothetical protein